MAITQQYTNEKINKKFTNQFDLVNYAIGIASHMILSGRPPRVKLNTENTALIVLEEISEGKDTLESSAEMVNTTEQKHHTNIGEKT